MGDYTRLNYGELPLVYDEEFSDYNFCKDFYYDSTEYLPGIKGTELEIGITFLNLNYLPVLTSRIKDNKRKYYLFDFIKIWQTTYNRDHSNDCKEEGIDCDLLVY